MVIGPTLQRTPSDEPSKAPLKCSLRDQGFLTTCWKNIPNDLLLMESCLQTVSPKRCLCAVPSTWQSPTLNRGFLFLYQFCFLVFVCISDSTYR